MTHKILTVIALLFFSFVFTTIGGNTTPRNFTESETSLDSSEKTSIEEDITQLYSAFSTKNSSLPNLSSFKNGLLGYYKLSQQDQVEKEILTIIDFTLSSTKKRLWVLDMKNQKVLFHSVVSHGKNTGGEFATEFSNTVNSLQSSLGFYITGETYFGKNGLSMFLDGMENQFNSRARERYVVMHGADYANPEFAAKLGRLGRSYGCPAVPTALTQEIIETIKDKSVLYIHSADKEYTSNSQMIRV